MKEKRLNQIHNYLEKTFKDLPDRLSHIELVREKAISLATLYHADIYKVEIAALLHDATKAMPYQKTVNWAKAIIGDDFVDDIPKGCMHAYSAVYLAMNEFSISDKDILNAIMYHCSGRKAMSLVEQIIYVSDFIEDSRTFVNQELRALANENLDEATYRIIEKTINYLKQHNQFVSKHTLEAYDYYRDKIGGNE